MANSREDLTDKTGSDAKKDGRKDRRTRNKKKVLNAFLDLVEEQRGLPSTEDVAERAGVSRRSIFRYFEDLDQLIAESYNFQTDKLREKFPPPNGMGPQDSKVKKIEEYIDHLSAIYEYTASMREVLSEKGLPPEIRTRVNRMISETLRERLANFFRPFFEDCDFEEYLKSKNDGEKKCKNLLYALEASLSPESWDYLRGSCGLSTEKAKQVWIEMLINLFNVK